MQRQSKKTRFQSFREIGEGSFSRLYQAYDTELNLQVALKVEKEDKIKRILKAEYEILKTLQQTPYIPKVYDFIDNNTSKNLKNLNAIEMELLGNNVSNFKKNYNFFTPILAYDILLQALESIEILHDKGFIHRDIKPTNFVLGKDDEANLIFNARGCPFTKSPLHIYMVDFGLSKIHLDKNNNPLQQRANADFKGTLTYASLNAHYKTDLSRRDDLWSFFFMILDLLNEHLPWRNCKDNKDEIKIKKEQCLNDPQSYLFLTTTKGKNELLIIFRHLCSLNYSDKPNYLLIQNMLNQMKVEEVKNMRYREINQFLFMNRLNYNSNPLIFPNMNIAHESYYPGIITSYQQQAQTQVQTHDQMEAQVQAQQAYINSQVQQLSQSNFYNLLGAGREIPFKTYNLSNYNNQVYENSNNKINQIFYEPFLNRKTNRNEEELNNVQEANSSFISPIVARSNNVTINNPTQHQIVIINQYPDAPLPISAYFQKKQNEANELKEKDKEKIETDYDPNLYYLKQQSKSSQYDCKTGNTNNYFFKEHYQPTTAPKTKKEEIHDPIAPNIIPVNNITSNGNKNNNSDIPFTVASYQYKNKIDINNDNAIINSLVQNLKCYQKKQPVIKPKTKANKKVKNKDIAKNDIEIEEQLDLNQKKKIFFINKTKKKS